MTNLKANDKVNKNIQMKVRCNKMVITKKDFETKEIEVLGFRKILKNPKDPDYKELKIYIKQGWIPIDPEDDEREIEKAKRRKQIVKKNKERRPKYEEMEKNIQKLDNKKLLDDFNAKRNIKNNYSNVLKWYNKEMEKIQKGEDTKQPKDKKETKSEEK